MTNATYPPDNDDIIAWVRFVGGDTDCFMRYFAGHCLYVPNSVARDHPLSQCLGHATATKLCEHVGSYRFSVPSDAASRAEEKRLLVLILSLARRSVNEMASAAEVTVRRICQIRRELNDAGLLPRAQKTAGIYNDAGR